MEIARALPPTPQPSPVAIFLPKGFEAIAAFLGTLYTRNFYVPLDVKTPDDRIGQILEDLRPSIVITNGQLHERVSEITEGTNGELVNLEDLSDCEEDSSARWLGGVDTDPIYCIYTSGSTGDPKGVLISHQSVADFISWVESTYEVDESFILGNQSPFVFDVSVLDIYSMLKCGCEMHIIPETLFSFPAKLLDYVAENSVSFIIWVPSVIMNVANADIFSGRNLDNLRFVLFAGEVMPVKQLNEWIRALPSAKYGNLYGPTEATVIATYYMIDRTFDDSESLPIGKPCRNVETLILSEDGTIATSNEAGELCLRGTSLALGYRGDPEKTRKAFVQNPSHDDYVDLIYKTGDLVKLDEDGNLLFLGRIDSQIKHLGYRIELGDIENVLGGFPNLGHCCTVYNASRSEIVVFYVSGSAPATDKDLRRYLSRKLPRYMVPERFIEMEELPTNQNGKIDRRKLADSLEDSSDQI